MSIGRLLYAPVSGTTVENDTRSTPGTEVAATVILALADIRAGMTVADVGAGNGDFAFRLADVVGPTGRV